MSTSIFVAYGGITLYPQDAALFKSNAWLNDTCINFVFQYLSKEMLSEEGRKKIVFVDPSVVSFLKLQCSEDEDYEGLFNGLELNVNAEVAFLPINDNDSFDSSCSHWSLLVVFLKEGIAYHIDSQYKGIRSTQAQEAEKTLHLFSEVLRYWDVFDIMEPNFQLFDCSAEMKVKQQKNGYDCGVFVCMYTWALMHELLYHGMSGQNGVHRLVKNAMGRFIHQEECGCTGPQSHVIRCPAAMRHHFFQLYEELLNRR